MEACASRAQNVAGSAGSKNIRDAQNVLSDGPQQPIHRSGRWASY